MASKRKNNETRRLLIDPSGQMELLDKSYQQELEEERAREVECLGMKFANDEARRTYFLDRLREHLQDPEFRKIEGFPIGNDEDILALSDPPYYTACPNPFIADFIKRYAKPYDPTDSYRQEPFASDVSEGRSGAVYDAHTYHTKVPHKAIMRYILHYTSPGDIVLDGFAGTGMTAVAAAMCSIADRELDTPPGPPGTRHAIVADICPAATFIAAGYTTDASGSAFATAAQHLIRTVQDELGWMYETCSDEGTPETIIYTVWSDVFLCSECGNEIVFWDSAFDAERMTLRDAFGCPQCGTVLEKRKLERRKETVFDTALDKPISVGKQVPAFVSVRAKRNRYERRINKHDCALLDKITNLRIPYDYPTNRMMNAENDNLCWGDKWRAGTSSFQHIHELYTRRNLIILAALSEHAKKYPNPQVRRALQFLVSSYNLAHSNKMARLIFKKGSKKPVLTGYQSGTLYVSSLSVEKNILHGLLTAKMPGIASLLDTPTSGALVTTQSSTQLQAIPDNSIDYVFTDPPFGDNLAYSELNFLSECWLKVFTNAKEEAIVSKHQGKKLETYAHLVMSAFSEFRRVLKPGRWMTVEFHNTKNAVWNAIQEALLRAGLVVADVRILDKKQGGFNAINAAGAVKQDLVISAYKPDSGLEERFKLVAGTEDGVWDFVQTHLTQLPVFVSKEGRAETIVERQNFLLFDRMVAFHVQRGATVAISAGEFYGGLLQRFAEREGMYFLPEQVAEYDRRRISVKEIMQLELFVTDEFSAIQWLKQQLTQKPQTFQELHPQFLKEIGGWQKHEKPLELSALLDENFLRYDVGEKVPSQIHGYLSTNFKDLRNKAKDDPALKAKAKDRWYVPDPNKAVEREKLREKDLLKEFDEYKTSKTKRLKVFRIEAMRVGFKRSYDQRDYQTIVDVAERIPDTVLQEDEKLLMYYDVARTRLGSDDDSKLF